MTYNHKLKSARYGVLEKNQRVIKFMYNNGATDLDIASEFNVTHQAVSQWRARRNLPRSRKPYRIQARWGYKALLMAKDGKGPDEIALALSQKKGTVYAFLRRARIHGLVGEFFLQRVGMPRTHGPQGNGHGT